VVFILNQIRKTELTFSMSTNKTTYKLGEKVLGKLILQNTGHEAIFINKRMACHSKMSPTPLREVTFHMIAPSGQELDFDPALTIYSLLLRPEDFVELFTTGHFFTIVLANAILEIP